MANEKLTAVFEAIDGISQTLDRIGQSVESLSNDFKQLDASMANSSVVSQQHEKAVTALKNEMDDLEDQIAGANRELTEQIGLQNVNIATAATNAGAMELAARAIDDAGDEALTTAGQMGVLTTVMDELALSGSALSVNIGAFNVSLRNLAPLIPIVATMGTFVTVVGALAASFFNAAVAVTAFTGAGAVAFAQQMQDEFEGLTSSAETFEAIMGGIRDLFAEAFEPIIDAETAGFFVDMVEGVADLANRFAQALDQMRDTFFPFFGQVSSLINQEFDEIATAIETTFIQMEPVVLQFIEWFLVNLPKALQFMADVTTSLAGPLGTLGDTLLETVASIINLSIHVFQGLAPAFSVAADLATELVNIIDVLGNGILQITLLIGGLSLAAIKFVGIADTLSNITLSAANSFNQLRSSINKAGGPLQFLSQTMQNQFEHLRALGMVMTGQMSIADAAGQTHKDFAEDIQNAAEKMQELENRLEDVRNEYASLVATVEGTDVGEQIADEASQGIRELDDASNSATSSVDDLANSVSGVELSGLNTGAQFRDSMSGTLISKSEVEDRMEIQEGVAAGFEGLDEIGKSAEDNITVFDRFGGAIAGVSNKIGPFNSEADSLGDAFSDLRMRMFGADSAIGGVTDSMNELLFVNDANSTKIGALVTNFDELLMSSMGFVESGVMDGFDRLSSGVTNATNSLYEMLFVNQANSTRIGALVTNFDELLMSAFDLAEAAAKSAYAFLRQGAASAYAKAQLALQTIATHGLTGATKIMLSSLWGSVTALAGMAAGALSSAAAFVGGLIPATIATGTALNVAFAGIPALIGALVAGAGLAVGVLGNLDNITSGAKNTFQGFKDALSAIGSALMKSGVPAWNLFIDILEAVAAPFFAIWDGLMMVGEALGIVSEDGGGLGSIVGMLIAGFDTLMATIGGMINFVAPAFSVLGDLLYKSFIIPFKIASVAIRLVIAVVRTLVDFLVNNVPFVRGFVNMMTDGFMLAVDIIKAIPDAFSSAFNAASDIVDDIMGDVMDMVEPVVEMINSIIESTNTVLGTDFDKLTTEREGRDVSEAFAGAQTSASEVRENMASDAEEPDNDEIASQPNVGLSFEESVENNVDVDADPEDKAGISRVVKDAMEEANSFERRRNGFTGN